mgnify:FL=1
MTSHAGSGTVAEIWLPRAATGVAAAPAAPAPAPHPPVGRATVLLVDDDPLVLEGTAAMLEDLGHAVLQADSAAAARGVLAGGAAVDLVLTDHLMPGVTGAALAAELRRTHPGLPVILATGYAEQAPEIEAVPRRLGKPFAQPALAAAVAEALAEARQYAPG